MYKTVLVKELIEDGEKLLQELDRRAFPLSAALWYLDPDRGAWKLVIASEIADTPGPLEAYMRIDQAMATLKGIGLSMGDIVIMSPKSRSFEDFRRKIEGVNALAAPEHRVKMEGLEFDDAHIYRWPDWEDSTVANRKAG